MQRAQLNAGQTLGRGGSIINIASTLGERVMPSHMLYSTSKAAVVHKTKSLALEWALYLI
ncbi:TPA: SDR family oxidoreductase [Pseudomonas putida]|nr:SDR family oxidoreductase [Pseudomonas putida]